MPQAVMNQAHKDKSQSCNSSSSSFHLLSLSASCRPRRRRHGFEDIGFKSPKAHFLTEHKEKQGKQTRGIEESKRVGEKVELTFLSYVPPRLVRDQLTRLSHPSPELM